MNNYPTSDALEQIVEKFRLRICEVVKNDVLGLSVFRVDFIAPDDENRKLVCGSSATGFNADMTPRQFTEQLRVMADTLDAYWARAFPTAIPDEERK